jgi:predicted ABC-type ATPase
LVIVINNVENVLARIKKRENETGRGVSINYTNDAYTRLSTSIPKYLSLDCEHVDSIYLYDNTKESINLIYNTICSDGVKQMKAGGKVQFSKRKYRRWTNKKAKNRNVKTIRKKTLNRKTKNRRRK